MQSIDVTERTYRRLLERIEHFGETAEDVIVRLLESTSPPGASADGRAAPASSPGKARRATPGTILPERAYWRPILAIIANAGGSMPANDVIDALESRIRRQLRERDFDLLEMGEVRWRNRARFARLRMKEQGLLSAESPRGVWEITARGREYLDAPS